MPRPTDAEVRQALRELLAEVPNTKALNYAAAYAQAGLQMEGKALRIQILYVLANTTHWRGEKAKAVKATLKAFHP